MSIPRDEDAPTEEQDRTASDVLATVIGAATGGLVFYVFYIFYMAEKIG